MKKLGWITVFCVAIFVFGAVKLFMLCFERGDVYPAYSSLRSDPLGVRVFYESLENLHRLRVDRNYRSIAKAPRTPDVTWFYLAHKSWNRAFYSDDFKAFLDRFSTLGGRLVISFIPGKTSRPDEFDPAEKPCGKPPKKEQPDPDRQNEKEAKKEPLPDEKGKNGNKEPAGEQTAVLDETDLESVFSRSRLDVEFDRFETKTSNHKAVRLESAGDESLPREIIWRSNLYFKSLGSRWKTIYVASGLPVIIERRWGRGTIVISADAYLFSNEAMRRNRHPDLLAWFTGPAAGVIFDESHFGITESRGIATLARKYRLQGLFFALVVVALLFVWKNAVSIIPSTAGGPGPDPSPPPPGGSGADGLVNLIRGNIPGEELLDVCFEAWEKTAARDKRISGDQIEKVKALVEGERSKTKKQRNPVETYREIHRVLKKK